MPEPSEPIKPSSSSSDEGSQTPATPSSRSIPVQNVAEPADTPVAPEEPSTETEASEPSTEPVPEPEVDKDVDAIVKQDGDEALKVQDDAAAKSVVMKPSHFEKVKNWFAAFWANPKKRYGTLGAILAILVVLMAIPLTRYNILGLVLKTQASVQVLDSKTGAAVSGATVELGGQKAQTDAKGRAVVRAHLGSKTLTVSKQYYRGYSQKELVTLSAGHNSFKASLTALGRQVKVKVVNKVTGKPVSGVVITLGKTQTKTATDGTVNIVVPGDVTVQKVNLSLSGYNTLAATITPDVNLAKNTFAITPAGKLYFLSNLSGKIDIVKTNLDGTDRQTVLAGTGNEDPNSTSLLASRDWKYLALLAKRDGANASIYLIDTTNGDKLTTIDQGVANFNLVGWSGDRFVYTVDRSATVLNWNPNQQALKSFNPTTGQTLLLDQTQGSGTPQVSYAKQDFTVYLMGDKVIYAKNWQGNSAYSGPLNGKQAELDSIGADGAGHTVIKTFAPGQYYQGGGYDNIGITTRLYEPAEIYIWFSYHGQDNFYTYEDGKVADNSNLNTDNFYTTPYPTYLLSPSGSSTFWSEQRDGKNMLFIGDKDAQSPKQIASLSDYKPYGWFTDDYLLVSKSSSELYIMPKDGGTPLKLTDYYKPLINYNGYGGGYGGL